jgi:nickel superoxide dismutase
MREVMVPRINVSDPWAANQTGSMVLHHAEKKGTRTMINEFTSKVKNWFPAESVDAHCDGPCGVYDPASARIGAEAVVSMTKKILALEPPAGKDQKSWAAYLNTTARFVQIKEQESQVTKDEVLVLWTDYFKPEHLEKYPDLHELVWKTTKLCSKAKHEVNLEAANELLDNVKKIHEIFWATKGRDIAWYTAS